MGLIKQVFVEFHKFLRSNFIYNFDFLAVLLAIINHSLAAIHTNPTHHALHRKHGILSKNLVTIPYRSI